MMRLLLMLSLALHSSLLQAQLASLRQSRIFAGDIAELTITYETGMPSMYVIDTGPLETDFRVLESNSRITKVLRDNRFFHRMHWSVRLLPRRSGNLAVPSLQFGDNRSEPLLLEVVPVSAAVQAAQNVFVEIEASPHNPYPGQQIRVVTRLYHNIPLQEIGLGEPTVGQAQVFRGAPDTRFRVTRNGEEFVVLERIVMVTPERAGELQLGAAVFRGIIQQPGGNEAHQLEGGIRHIYRESNTLTLPVRDLPATFDSGDWLPAQRLQMQLTRDSSDDDPRPGEPLTLTLELQGIGLSAHSLPANLLLRPGDNFKIYADPERRSTRVDGPPGREYLRAELRQGYAVVAQRPGDFTLPALELRWWDVEQDRARVARLEATAFTVAGPESAAEHTDFGAAASAASGSETVTTGLQYSWPWLLALLCGLLIASLPWTARRQYAGLLARLEHARKLRRCRMRVEQACRENDAKAARQWLIDWGRARWNDDRIHGLRQIALRAASRPWTEQLARLDAAVFAEGQGEWQGRALAELLPGPFAGSNERRGSRQDSLADPYPRHAG